MSPAKKSAGAPGFQEPAKADRGLERYRELFFALPVNVLIFTCREKDFVLTGYNKASHEYTGGRIESALGMTAAKIFRNHPLIVEDLKACRDGRCVLRARREYPGRRAGGKVYGEFSYAFVEPDEILVTVEDVTERRLSEASLKESEQLYRNVAANLPSGSLFIFNHELRYTLVESSGGWLAGLPPRPLEGKSVREVYAPDVAEKIEDVYQRALSGEEVAMEIGLGGRWYMMHVFPIKSEQDEVVAGMALAQDVTDLKEARDALARAKEMAEAASSAKSDFLANMSHEMRTPISGIMGMTDLLMTSSPTPKQREYLAMIKDSVTSLHIVINDILDLSKIEAGKLRLNPVEFDLHASLEQSMRPFAYAARQKGLALKLRIAPDVPRAVTGDSYRLNQIVTNLISNAVKFTSKGAVVLAVACQPECDKENPAMVLCVNDTGPGIPAGKQELLFQNFSQLDSSYSKRFGGTGLGLAISKQLVELMGGRIWLRSVEGKGSSFYFTVPFKEAEHEVQHAGLEPEDIHSELASLPSLKVLFAEDNLVNQTFLTHFLTEAGHQVTSVANGREALAELAARPFDLVLMDIQMPEMDGIEATRRIRSDTSGRFDPNVPIVALTAYAMLGDRERFLEAGMNEYIAKPIDFAALAEVMARVANVARRPEEEVKAVERQEQESGPLLDEADALRRVRGNRALLERLRRVFATEIPRIGAEFEAALGSGVLSEVHARSHSLKGSAKTIGATSLHRLALQMEQAAEEADLEGAREIYVQLKDVLRQLAEVFGNS